MVFLHSHSDIYMEEFLYDLENDIYEKNNLINETCCSKAKAELTEILKRKMAEVGEGAPKIVPFKP